MTNSKMPLQPCAIGPGRVPRDWPNAEALQKIRPHFKSPCLSFFSWSLSLSSHDPSTRRPSALHFLLLLGVCRCRSCGSSQEPRSTEAQWMCLMPALLDMLHVGAELQPLLVPILPIGELPFPTIAPSDLHWIHCIRSSLDP